LQDFFDAERLPLRRVELDLLEHVQTLVCNEFLESNGDSLQALGLILV
jgi:hypothetical protein